MAGGTPLGQMYIELGLDVSKFNPSLTSAKNAVKYFQNNVKALDSTLKNNGKSTELLKAKYKSLGQAIEAQKKVLDQMKQNFDKLDPGSAKFDKAAADIERENAKLSAMEGQLYKVEQALKAVGRENSFFGKMENFGKNLVKSGDHIQQFGKKVSDFGGTLTKGVTAPLLASAGFAVKAAVDYESAFAGVRKTVDATEGEYKKMSNAIREASKTMPASAADIARVAESAGQLGIKKQNIVDFSKTMIDLGESTNMTADEAATAMARFANIVQMPQSEFRRLGSTIVDLGNNFATTESEIMEMGLRLAGTGHLVGLTEPQIMAVATAMSSVGINAEAGGSSFSRVMQKINTQVLSGGKKLELFAKVSGMSAKDFAHEWKTEPQIALLAFLDGLKKVKESGGDVTQTLKELGIKSTQEVDTMQRMAGAGDLLSRALKTANGAWKENTALTNEAKKRYETTESQLKIFKNQITDLAIEFGGPLLKAMNSGLQAAKPWIQKLADMAKAFSEMSEAQQQNIIKWGLLAAGAGPALSILGKFIGVIGGVKKGIGFLTQGIGKLGGGLTVLGRTFQLFKEGNSLSSAFKTATTGITATSTAAEGAVASTGLLAKGIALLGNPVTWGVLIGGVAVGVIAAVAKEMADADERTRTWGTSVNKVQAEELSKLKAKVDDAHQAMIGFGKGGAQAVENVRKSVQGLSDDLQKAIDKDLQQTQKNLEKIGASEEYHKRATAQAEQQKQNIQAMTDEIIQIYQNAADQHRNITREEQAVIYDYENQFINEQLKLQKYSADERTAIMKAMNGQINDLNETQLRKGTGVVAKWLQEEQKLYNDQVKALKDAHEKGIYNQSEYNQEMEKLNAQHKAKMDAFGREYAALQKKWSEKVPLNFGDDRQRQMYFNQMRKEWAELGLDYDKLMAKADQFADVIGRSSGMVAKDTINMSKETKEANLIWKSLIWDPKTASVKTNAQEEVTKALQAENGWENMQFILKHANLETNAKMTIGQALVEVGKWESLTPQEKELVVGNNQGMKAVLDSKTLLEQYNAMPAEVKELLMKNTDFLSSGERATAIIERWNTLTPEQKELILKDAVSDKAERVRLAVDSLTGMAHVVNLDAEDKTKSAIASAMSSILTLPTDHKTDLIATPDGVTLGTNQAMSSLGLYNGFSVPTKPLTVDPSNATNGAQQAINKQQEWNNTPSPVKPQLGDPTGAITAARQAISTQNAWNATPSPTKIITADASGAQIGAMVAKGAIMSIPTSWTTVITTIRQEISRHAHGTNYHGGGLAMVNDQRNPVYKEMVTLPDGSSFIPDGRDVVLDLPRGSKVLRADRTKRLMKNLGFPKYATGVGIPEDAKFLREMQDASKQFAFLNKSSENSYTGENIVAEIAILRSSLEKILTAILEKPSETYLDGDVLAQNSYQRYSKIMAREGI
jgi:TP901 family phage tail tape measure protein